MSEPFRWGILGPGRIAEKFAKDLQVVPDAALVAVASRSGGQDFARKFSVPVVYDSYQALAEDPNIDAVYIATPHNFHYEQAKLCLEAGKPVLVEKPLTVNAKEAEALIELSQRKGVFLMEALWSRFLPVYQTVRNWLDHGMIGEVIALRASFCFRARQDEQDRWLNPNLAGGTLLDLGIYPISVFQWITGQNPVNVQALGTLGDTGVDITLSVNMQYPDGILGHFVTSFEFNMKNDLLISGAEGSIHIHGLFGAATSATLDANGMETTVTEPHRSSGFEYEIEEATRCIREGRLESSHISHAETLANIQVMDDIREQIGLIYPFE
ncbi:Gfo/Idh/MocA family oxidoreductase [bacterium]|nr:Gfo/Idh/MocA family oxidoreductase [bacterium]MCB2179061.1 Gfo/Idh/MocA family oxidoreductase [bacterium]